MKIKTIQKQLSALGFYKGDIDGRNGPLTKKAIIKFQSFNPGLKVDGIAGQNTKNKLFYESLKNNILVLPGYKDLTEFYGPMGKNMGKINLPYTMKLAWDLNVKINKFSCNKKIVRPLESIFKETLNHYGLAKIQHMKLDLFGGCVNVRKMHGGNKWSTHSWGIAIDLAPAQNQLRWGKDKALFAKPQYDVFWEIVESHGGVSLGREKGYDFMHIQWCEA